MVILVVVVVCVHIATTIVVISLSMVKKDIVVILFVFFLVFLSNYVGFSNSLKRQRDIQRILDIGKIESGLRSYRSEYGAYPLSTDDGRILACPGPNTKYVTDETGKPVVTTFKKSKLKNLIPCEWGKDSLWDATDINYPAYIDGLPKDPMGEKGYKYIYRSDGNGFEIYGHLELREHKEFDNLILKKNIDCGKVTCNFGREIVVK
jgi:type II secretory pathway pseudopilin PulG